MDKLNIYITKYITIRDNYKKFRHQINGIHYWKWLHTKQMEEYVHCEKQYLQVRQQCLTALFNLCKLTEKQFMILVEEICSEYDIQHWIIHETEKLIPEDYGNNYNANIDIENINYQAVFKYKNYVEKD